MQRQTFCPTVARMLLIAAAWLFGAATLAPPAISQTVEPQARQPASAEAAGSGTTRGQEASESSPHYTTETLRGRVVWLAEALRRRWGVETDADWARSLVALEVPGAGLYPIAKDACGRGFYLDPRLHQRDWELLVRRYDNAPTIQVIRTYTIKDGKKYQFDYWCDICAIMTYELKTCECCQGPVRMRERLVGDAGGGAANQATRETKSKLIHRLWR